LQSKSCNHRTADFSQLMPPLSSSTVFCLQRCHSMSFVVFLLFSTIRYTGCSFSIQSIYLLFGRPLDLFPVGFHWCTLLVGLSSSFIRNICPSHLIASVLHMVGHCMVPVLCPLSDRFVSDHVFISNPHYSEPAIFTGITDSPSVW